MERPSHLVEIWERYRSNIPIAFLPSDKRNMQAFQQDYAECLHKALHLYKCSPTPKPFMVSYYAEAMLWLKYWDWEECHFQVPELDRELNAFYDAGLEDGGKACTLESPSDSESQPLSRQTTNTNSTQPPSTQPSTQPLSNTDLLFCLMDPPAIATAELPTINSAPQTFSKSLSPLAQTISKTKLSQKASIDSKHAQIMSMFLSPSAVSPQTPPTTPKPISTASALSVLAPLVAIPAGIEYKDPRVHIRIALQSEDPNASAPQQGWAADGTPKGSVRLLAENFAESYDKPNENDLVPKKAFERRTKGIFVLRAAIVQGIIYIWLEFAPQHARLKADCFWMQIWEQSCEFLPFLRDRQYKDEDGKLMMRSVNEEYMEWKKSVDQAGYVVLLDLTAKALKCGWKKGVRGPENIKMLAERKTGKRIKSCGCD